MTSTRRNYDPAPRGYKLEDQIRCTGSHQVFAAWWVGVDTATGYALSASDGQSASTVLGMCSEECDNSTGAAGAKDVKFYGRGTIVASKFTGSIGRDDINRPVYVSADADKVALSGAVASTPALVNYLRAGRVYDVHPSRSDLVYVYVDPQPAGNDS